MNTRREESVAPRVSFLSCVCVLRALSSLAEIITIKFFPPRNRELFKSLFLGRPHFQFIGLLYFILFFRPIIFHRFISWTPYFCSALLLKGNEDGIFASLTMKKQHFCTFHFFIFRACFIFSLFAFLLVLSTT